MIRNPGTSRLAGLSAGWTCWAALGVFTVAIGIGFVPLSPTPLVASLAAAVAIGAWAVIVWQRQGRYLLGWAALSTAGVAVIAHTTSTSLAWFAVCLIGIWCALSGTRREVLAYWLGTLILFAAEWIWIKADPGWAAWMAGSTLAVGAGLVVRHERELVAQLRDAQAGLAEKARVQERNRIASELHDVIAHTLSVSLLHVTGARLAAENNLADAAQALAEAERLGRQSLDEVRMAVGMLHQRDGQAPMAPLPDARNLPTLVEQFRSAGGDVTYAVKGDPSRLPATTGLALYRIMQEALTNAIKHAPGAHTAVELGVDNDGVQLEVDTAAMPGTGTGFGLVSMRERAESLGGSCEAGPGGHGWLVRAMLPVDPGRRRGRRDLGRPADGSRIRDPGGTRDPGRTREGVA